MAGDYLGLTPQTGFVTKALVGLFGSDKFQLAVSEMISGLADWAISYRCHDCAGFRVRHAEDRHWHRREMATGPTCSATCPRERRLTGYDSRIFVVFGGHAGGAVHWPRVPEI